MVSGLIDAPIKLYVFVLERVIYAGFEPRTGMGRGMYFSKFGNHHFGTTKKIVQTRR